MDKKKVSRVIALSMIIGVIAYAGFRNQWPEENTYDAITSTSEEAEKVKTTTESSEEGETERVFTDESDTGVFQIINMRQEMLELMGLEQAELAEELKAWTYYNGYSMATSATFYAMITIDYSRNLYSLTMRLNDDVGTIINMEYYKDKKNLVFSSFGPRAEENQ